MDRDIVSEPTYSGREARLRYGVPPHDRTVRHAELRLSRRTALLAILLSSLGLWAAIWAAVHSLTQVWLP